MLQFELNVCQSVQLPIQLVDNSLHLTNARCIFLF